jgi:hypothetical protein
MGTIVILDLMGYLCSAFIGHGLGAVRNFLGVSLLDHSLNESEWLRLIVGHGQWMNCFSSVICERTIVAFSFGETM